jgi:hypothetical protein
VILLEILWEAAMEKPSLVSAVNKLAIAGQQAGFSLEQMIELLNSGLTVLTLLDLISWRLNASQIPTAPSSRPSCWIA